MSMPAARRRRSQQPSVSNRGQTSIIKYSSIGTNIASGATGVGTGGRKYVPGWPGSIVNTAGTSVVSYYSTAKFLPGTTIRWEPSVGFTTSGRVFVGFSDNPEVIAEMESLRAGDAAAQLVYGNLVKGMYDVVSFPVYQETDIHFPQRMRRKMFDVNVQLANDVNVYDRSCQQSMHVWVEGCPVNTTLGSLWFHDVIEVEGLHAVPT